MDFFFKKELGAFSLESMREREREKHRKGFSALSVPVHAERESDAPFTIDGAVSQKEKQFHSSIK